MPAQKLLAGYGISIVRCHLTSKLLIRALTIQYWGKNSSHITVVTVSRAPHKPNIGVHISEICRVSDRCEGLKSRLKYLVTSNLNALLMSNFYCPFSALLNKSEQNIEGGPTQAKKEVM